MSSLSTNLLYQPSVPKKKNHQIIILFVKKIEIFQELKVLKVTLLDSLARICNCGDFCRETPQLFARSISRDNLSWLFVLGLFCVCRQTFFLFKQILFNWKKTFYMWAKLLFIMFSLLTVFLFVIGVAVIGQRTLDFNNVNFNT